MRLIQWMILGLPWVILYGVREGLHLPKEAVLQTGGLAIILVSLFQGRIILPFRSVWLQRLFLWVLLQSAVIFWWPLLTLKPTSNLEFVAFHVWMTLLDVLIAGLLIWVLSSVYLPRMDCWVRISQWLCWSAMAVAAYALCQYLGFDQLLGRFHNVNHPDVQPYAKMLAGLGHHAYVAMYLSLILPLFLAIQGWRYIGGFCLVLLAIGLSHVHYVWVATILSLLTYALFWSWQQFPRARRLLPYFTLILCGIGLLVAWQHRSLLLQDERWVIWQVSFDHLRLQHLTGFGLGNFETAFSINWVKLKEITPALVGHTQPWKWMHNDLLQWVYETGFIGGGLLLLAMSEGARNLWQRIHLPASPKSTLAIAWAASAISLLLLSLTNFPWHLAPCAWVGILIVAVCLAPEPQGGSA